MIIAPSILSADFAALGDDVKKVSQLCEWIHIDVMDGHFVPNITIGPVVVKALRRMTDKIFDVHLMISEPEKYIEEFAKAGADYITVHTETCDAPKAIEQIRGLGKKAGISIKPGTPIDDALKYLDSVDLVLVMSVEPGFGGQEFMENSILKIKKLREEIDKKGLSVLISVDGGINSETAKKVKDAGVDVLVAGSYIFGSDDYGKAVESLR